MRLSFLSRLGIATMLRLTLWTLTVDTEDSQWRRCCTQCFISEQRAAYCWFISASTSMLLTVALTNPWGSGCATTALWVGRPHPTLPHYHPHYHHLRAPGGEGRVRDPDPLYVLRPSLLHHLLDNLLHGQGNQGIIWGEQLQSSPM